MAIQRKPQPQASSSATVDINALINKGGSVSSDRELRPEEEKEITAVMLRVPTSILKRVNEALASRRLKTPRHTWILEAIIEKLDREGEEISS